MPDHNVTLTYVPNNDAPSGDAPYANLTVDPARIEVLPGQTIGFQLGTESDGKYRITFLEPEYFTAPSSDFANTGVLNEGDGEVSVMATLYGPTTYHCQLVDAQGNTLAESHELMGGEVVPVSA